MAAPVKAMLEQSILANATEGEVTIFTTDDGPSDLGYTFTLNLGHLDPVDETSGVDARLTNPIRAESRIINCRTKNGSRRSRHFRTDSDLRSPAKRTKRPARSCENCMMPSKEGRV